jgi:putative hydrolase of the HAD superfamily
MALRKPSPEIYRRTIERLGVDAGDITFVDDRPRNLEAARTLGIRTVLFDTGGTAPDTTHRHIRQLEELL